MFNKLSVYTNHHTPKLSLEWCYKRVKYWVPLLIDCIVFVFYIFTLGAIYLCTTGLKALFGPSDFTSTAQAVKLLTFPKLKDRISRLTIYERP